MGRLVGEANTDVRNYYENEARLRERQPVRGRSVELRDEFLHLLQREGRTSVLDFGAGPGRDGEAFLAAGHRFVGVDLAHGNARLAAEAHLRVIQGSLTALPARSSAFDAGWSLSTLMHLDEAEAALAVDEMFRTLRPFAPFVVGVWGRESEALVTSSSGTSGYRRPFHLRSFERNGRLLTSRADLEASVR